MRKLILTATALLAGLLTSSASVTVEGWWHYGEVPDYYADSSTNSRRFALGFSCAGGGNAGAGIVGFGCGGPLGTTGFSSTNALYWTPLHCSAAAMWNPWGTADVANEWNPPPTNYVIECWILPENIEGAPTTTWIFASGSGDFSQPDRPARTGAGGVKFVWDKSSGTAKIGAYVIANATQGVPADVQIGDFVDADFNAWMHIAVVNDNGTNTFYVNGVKKGASTDINTIPNGNIFAGGSPGTTPSFHGWMDELRISTFAPGAFSISDLLTRPAGPSINVQPQSATVWNGGAAPFTVVAALDPSVTYQWQRLGTVFTNVPGATAATLIVPQVSLADDGAQFRCILTSASISVTSSVATVTVAPNRTADVNYYRAGVTGQPSVAAYFPADDCLGTTLTNIVDLSRNGQLEGIVTYDGRTNRAFGQRAVTFAGAGDVQIPNNPAFEFSGGNGTIEALVYLEGVGFEEKTIFAWAQDGGTIGYALQASRDGAQLIYVNDAPTSLSWTVPANLLGRLTHVALVIDNTTNVTAIVDGQSLGTKVQTSLGAATGAPAWIGALGTSLAKPFRGTIDEVSVYGTALSLNAIQVHYSRYLYGTNVSAPSILSQSGPRTVLAGTAPLLQVAIAGTLPITYQWKSNDVAIAGANAATFKVVSGPGSTAANYVLYATNDVGWTNSQPIAITFVAPPSPYSAAVASDHPMAYWRLNEASGTTAVDSAGYHDATYNGTVLFGAQSVITTETDPAVNFSNLLGEARLSNYPELNPAGAFSVELWTRPNSSDSGGIILGSQNRNNSRGGYVFHCNYFYAEYGIDLGAPNSSVTRYISSTLPQAGVPVHLVFAWDGVSPQGAFYLNGQKTTEPDLSFADDMTQFVNNTVTPLTIGKRYDGAGPWDGVVDEVAFYDYALSDAQVTNHWSFSWMAPAITQNPVNVTTNEGSTVSLTVVASGYPLNYQWYMGTTALLADAQNADGTFHYPQGVNSSTLVIAQTLPADSGLYHVVVANGLGTQPSGNATVTINADTTPPVVASVQALGTPNGPPNPAGSSPYLVKVLFNKRIMQGSGTFTIGGTTVGTPTWLTEVGAAALGTDWRMVVVPTSGLTPGASYTLNVSGVKDQTTTGNTIVTTNVPFRAPLLSQGLVVWDYYYLGTGGGLVADLTGNFYYPNAPMTNWSSSTFDSTPITGGDLVNRGFGSAGEHYGASLSGWITPTVSGNYEFFLASDDPSELWMNTNSVNSADPQGVTLIAYEAGCCHGFVEKYGTNTYTSDPVYLAANTAYFIRALQTENVGGDYVKVAWRIAGDTTPAASLKPIAGQFLSSYAPGPVVFNPVVYTGGVLTISWTGTATLLQSTNVTLPMSQWTAIDTSSPYQVTPATGAPRMFYRLQQ